MEFIFYVAVVLFKSLCAMSVIALFTVVPILAIKSNIRKQSEFENSGRDALTGHTR